MDATDACPDDPEDKDTFEDDDGCPDPDNDKDEILDVDDKCPMDPEDKDDFEDQDGCPDPDNDKDGILDVNDKCPMDPEDIDAFEDEDGCPDMDNDRDGIEDYCDMCPNEGETWNGASDEDGCPDSFPPMLANDPIVILDTVAFPHGSATVTADATRLLEDVAALLLGNPQVRRVGIHGHTDRRERDGAALSRQRAQAVHDALVAAGVSADRLLVYGDGSGRPRDPGRSAAAQAANRRVRFDVELTDPPEPEPPRDVSRPTTPPPCHAPYPSAC
jgi:outer membrane protein OmpA-like peptidoglycan-associated protein